MKSAALTAQQLSMQLSPILLTNGIAQLIPGGMLPIIALTEALNFTGGLLSGAEGLSLDSCFANFDPLPGSTLISNQYGTYPFANNAVAANAVIQQPLNISLKMTCPARAGGGGFAGKLATMVALQAALKLHTNKGGTYTVVTPAAFYTDCLLLDLKESGAGQSSQPQSIYVWDFYAPLLTEEQAIVSMNGMMSKIDASLPSTGALSGIEVAGLPQSLTASSLSPSMANLSGAGIAGPGGFTGY